MADAATTPSLAAALPTSPGLRLAIPGLQVPASGPQAAAHLRMSYEGPAPMFGEIKIRAQVGDADLAIGTDKAVAAGFWGKGWDFLTSALLGWFSRGG
jgi:hypothetical protein